MPALQQVTVRKAAHICRIAVPLACIAVLLASCDRLREKPRSQAASSSVTSAPSAASQSVYADIAARAASGVVLHVESPNQCAFHVLTNTVPVLILFHSPASVPATAMCAVADRLAKDYAHRLLVMTVELNQAALRPLESQYIVKEMPVMLLMRDGRELLRLTGVQQYDEVAPRIDQHMPSIQRP